MNSLTAHAVLYPNDDGSYDIRSLHSSRDCAINSIPVFEGRLVAGIAEVELLQPAPSGMQLRIQHAAATESAHALPA